jgi:hypothetical protein
LPPPEPPRAARRHSRHTFAILGTSELTFAWEFCRTQKCPPSKDACRRCRQICEMVAGSVGSSSVGRSTRDGPVSEPLSALSAHICNFANFRLQLRLGVLSALSADICELLAGSVGRSTGPAASTPSIASTGTARPARPILPRLPKFVNPFLCRSCRKRGLPGFASLSGERQLYCPSLAFRSP